MKKHVLLLVLLLVTTICTAQVSKTAVSVTSSYWSATSRAWVDYNTSSVDIVFVLYKTKIIANDKAQSKYFIINNRPDYKTDTYSTSSWDCYDEKGRKCIFSIGFYQGGKQVFFVFYDDVCFTYTMKSDPFD